MPYAALEKEIETLPHAAISEVVDFIRLIKLKFPEENSISQKNPCMASGRESHFTCPQISMNLLNILLSICN